MSGTTAVKFCTQCGDKRIKEVTRQLEQLLNTKELHGEKCVFCHEPITDESIALRVTERFTKSPQKGASLREHDILEQSGVSLTSKGDQSIIPVLLNVIRQLGKTVVHITHQHGESGSLDSLVTLADVVGDDQKDGNSSKPPKTLNNSGHQQFLHKSQGNIQGENAPANQTHDVNETVSGENFGYQGDESDDDDIADPLPNSHDLHTDSVEAKHVPEVQENSISQESQLPDMHAPASEVPGTHVKGLQLEQETNASSINPAFNSTDLDECDLKDILVPQVFDILNSTSEKYMVCKFCPLQCVSTGIGIRKLLKHAREEHPNLPVIEKPFRCPRCGFKVDVRARLAMHMTSCGLKEKPFKCPVCKKGFFSLCSLGTHIRSGRHGDIGRPRTKVAVKKRGKRGRPRKYPVVEKTPGKRGRPRKNADEEEEYMESSFDKPQNKVLSKVKKRKLDVVKKEPGEDTKRQRACKVDKKGKHKLATSRSDKRVEKTANESISLDQQDTSRRLTGKLRQTPNVVLKPLSASQLMASASPTTSRKSKTNKTMPGEHRRSSLKTTKKTSSKCIDDLQSILDFKVLDMIHPKSDYTNNSIVCKVCFEPFLSQGHSFITFLTHISEHNKTPCIQEPYVCRDCGLSFKFKQSVRAHFEKLHGDEDSYECHVCCKKYTLRNSYLRHMRTEHSDVQVETSIADGDEVSVKVDVDDLSVVLDKQILDMVHQDCDFTTSLICKVCKETFRTTVIGVKHFTWHVCNHKGIEDIEQPYRCPDGDCDQSFSSPVDLKSHYTSTHVQNTKKNAYLKCLHCPESFDSIEVLKKHHSVHVENDWEGVSARMQINEEEEYVDIAINEVEPDVDNEQEEVHNTSLLYESDNTSQVSETEKTFNDDLSVILVADLKAMVHEECNMRDSIVCKVCSESFQTGERSIRQFAKHVAEHTGEAVISAVYQCADCSEQFRGLYTLESHWITAHDDDEDGEMEKIGSDASDGDDVMDDGNFSEGSSSGDDISDKEGEKEIYNGKLNSKEKEQIAEYADTDVNGEEECKNESSGKPKFQRSKKQESLEGEAEEPNLQSSKEQEEQDESPREPNLQSSKEQESQDESPREPNIQKSKEQEGQEELPGEPSFQTSEEQEGQDELPGEPNFQNSEGQEGQDGSSGEPKFQGSKLATNLIPEVLEAIHKNCDLKKYITCKYCQQMFTNGGHGMTYFLKHIVKHTGKPVIQKPYLCTECGDKFKRSFELYQHSIHSHHVDGNYKCQHCEKSYRKRNSLYKHMRDIHRTTVASKESFVMCELCGKEVKVQNLKNHESVHTGVWALYCDVPGCTFKTNTKRYLDQHKAHSHKPKSDLCRFCGLSFPLQGALAIHEQKHINNEPIIFKKHRCSQCGFSADKISDLDKHERRHKKEYRYQCTNCDQKFLSRRGCRIHIPYCQKRQGLPVTDKPRPIDLFVRKRRSKYDNYQALDEPEPEVPVAVEQVQEELAAEETVTFTVDSLEHIPVATVEAANSPAVEIATAIANLRYMQSQ